jgi:hypothetical protein
MSTAQSGTARHEGDIRDLIGQKVEATSDCVARGVNYDLSEQTQATVTGMVSAVRGRIAVIRDRSFRDHRVYAPFTWRAA